ncbi:hypothetical protein V8F33_009944 [Rhypophila sp. PSN 637]
MSIIMNSLISVVTDLQCSITNIVIRSVDVLSLKKTPNDRVGLGGGKVSGSGGHGATGHTVSIIVVVIFVISTPVACQRRIKILQRGPLEEPWAGLCIRLAGYKPLRERRGRGIIPRDRGSTAADGSGPGWEIAAGCSTLGVAANIVVEANRTIVVKLGTSRNDALDIVEAGLIARRSLNSSDLWLGGWNRRSAAGWGCGKILGVFDILILNF